MARAFNQGSFAVPFMHRAKKWRQYSRSSANKQLPSDFPLVSLPAMTSQALMPQPSGCRPKGFVVANSRAPAGKWSNSVARRESINHIPTFRSMAYFVDQFLLQRILHEIVCDLLDGRKLDSKIYVWCATLPDVCVRSSETGTPQRVVREFNHAFRLITRRSFRPCPVTRRPRAKPCRLFVSQPSRGVWVDVGLGKSVVAVYLSSIRVRVQRLCKFFRSQKGQNSVDLLAARRWRGSAGPNFVSRCHQETPPHWRYRQ